MPRQPRLDAPNTLHHVMVRRIERRPIFPGDTDRSDFLARVCRAAGLAPAHLAAGNRRPAATRARAGIAYLWTEVLGHPGRPLAPVLGVFPAAVYKAARRGGTQASVWQRLLGKRSQEA